MITGPENDGSGVFAVKTLFQPDHGMSAYLDWLKKE